MIARSQLPIPRFQKTAPGAVAQVYRGRPEPPRSIRATPGTMEATIVWLAPADLRGVDRFRIYQGNENNLIGETENRITRQFKVKLPSDAADMVYVSSVSDSFRESRKVPVRVSSNNDKYVVDGAADATAGTPAAPAPGWPYEPGGGCPMSGAPVKLYGDPAWWTSDIRPCEWFIKIITNTGRSGSFSFPHRQYTRRGLVEASELLVGDHVLTEDGEEKLVSVIREHVPDGRVDDHRATQGHVYSAWGFVGHNKYAPPEF